MRRTLHNSILVVLGIVAGLLLCETSLQVAAFVTWRHARQLGAITHPEHSGAERIVVCVGDSNTFGIGASAPHLSYPAQLERELNASDRG